MHLATNLSPSDEFFLNAVELRHPGQQPLCQFSSKSWGTAVYSWTQTDLAALNSWQTAETLVSACVRHVRADVFIVNHCWRTKGRTHSSGAWLLCQTWVDGWINDGKVNEKEIGLRLLALRVTEQPQAPAALADMGWRSRELINIWKNSDADLSAALWGTRRSDMAMLDMEASKDRFGTEWVRRAREMWAASS